MTAFRRSTLQSMQECPRRTLHEITSGLNDIATGRVGATGELGQAVHLVIAECLRRMRHFGNEQISTQEAVEVAREILGASRFVLPAEQMEDLRWLVVTWASNFKLNPARIMAVEERLEAEVVCPDGKVRTVYGTPDLLVANPPDGVIVPDWKSGRGQPKRPRVMPEGPIVGKQYLADGSLYQLHAYGLLVMRNFPRAQRVTLSEIWLRLMDEPPHRAVLSREELEHVEFEIGLHMQKLDEALTEGEGSGLWQPRPGRHCARKCSVSRSCPIPAEQRGVGALDSPEAATAEADRFVMVDGLRTLMRDSLRAWHEEVGEFIPLGDNAVLGWHADEDGSRSFEARLPNGAPVLPARVACPECDAGPDEACKGARGGFLKRPHPERLRAAVQAATEKVAA